MASDSSRYIPPTLFSRKEALANGMSEGKALAPLRAKPALFGAKANWPEC